jgi:hypothetical protein
MLDFPMVCSLPVRWIGAVLLLLLAGTARGDEHYYLLVFGSQRDPSQPQYTHSFGTFVKVTGGGECPCTLEAHTISWLPQSLEIRLARLRPECGVNLDLHPTLRYVLSEDERVSYWGPFEIERDLYCRALQQIALLDSGTVRYKAVDTGYPTDVASNCIHALTSTVGGYRTRVLSPSWGETASSLIVRRFRPWIIDPDQEHPWVRTALGLDCYPMIHRELEDRPRLQWRR